MSHLYQRLSCTSCVRFALFLTLTVTLLLSHKGALAQSSTLYLPFVQSIGNVPSSSLPQSSCTSLSSEEKTIADLATASPGQGREFMVCNPILAEQARAKAVDMGTRNYFGHTNPEGVGANKLVRDAGYPLPGYYGSDPDSNNIESLAAGYATAEEAWAGWLSSVGHRVHVLGENDFYAQQVEIGVGYAYVEDSTYKHYWVFFSAYNGNLDQ